MNKYYINEQSARTAKEMNSFSDYKEMSATTEYENYLNKDATKYPRLQSLFLGKFAMRISPIMGTCKDKKLSLSL